MSSMDTKWKKKVKGINNKEGLENKADNSKITRDEKDEAQTKMLNDLKNRLRNIKNKRNGFTKLPHLTDIKEDVVIKENDDIKEDDDIKENDDIKEDFKEGNEDDDKKYPYGFVLITSYVVFLITYLQLYHLNFKESIKSNFPESYPTPMQVDEDNTAEDELPREWTAISANILDSLTKTIGSYVWSDEYTDIKHNLFLKNMNFIARFGMKYLFIPTQVVVAITQNLIPNLTLVPVINKITFPLIFTLLFLSFYGATFTKIDAVSEIRNYADNKKWEGWDWFVKYYATIPTSYFVMVTIIIIVAYGLDISKEMSDGTFFKDGLFAAFAKTFVAIFSISMSVVLSGFSAIPLGIFAFLWIVFPEGVGKPQGGWFGLTKWSNAIRDNYWVPEWDSCEKNVATKWVKYLLCKAWNNKILISSFIILDVVLKLSYGHGSLTRGKEFFDEISGKGWWWLYFLFPFIFILWTNLDILGSISGAFNKYTTTREKNLLSYFWSPIHDLIIFIWNKMSSPIDKKKNTSIPELAKSPSSKTLQMV